jgi:hypothetical protein
MVSVLRALPRWQPAIKTAAINIPTPINHQSWFSLRLQVMLVAYVSPKARQVQAPTKFGSVTFAAFSASSAKTSVLPLRFSYANARLTAEVIRRLPQRTEEKIEIRTRLEGSSGQRTQFAVNSRAFPPVEL